MCAAWQAAEVVGKRMPVGWDDVAQLLEDAVRYKMVELLNTRAGFAELLELNVTMNSLQNARACLTLYVLQGLGMQCFNMRNGPVTESKQYLQPLQQSLLASELDRHSPEKADTPNVMLLVAQHINTFEWVKVGWGPGRAQLV